MTMLIDSHCHLDDDRYGHSLELLLADAIKVGVQQFVVPATTMKRWSIISKLNELYPCVHVAYGLHPMFMAENTLSDVDSLEQTLAENNAVAVGECGLDFFLGNDDEGAQLALFEAQLDIAKNMHLPCIIHSRKSLDRVLSILRKKNINSGVIHSFSGSLQQAKQLTDLGFKLGIAATVCFDRAKKLQKVVKEIDLGCILLESDAPDQSGPLHRGQLNRPAYITDVLKKIAELKQLDAVIIARQTVKNTKNLFNLSY